MTTRGQGNLPSNTEVNPRDVKAITLRSGKELKSKDEMDKCVSNSALGLLYGHGILTIYENLLL